MDLQTLIIAMSIPSGVTAFCFWLIEQKIKKQQTEADEKEKARENGRHCLRGSGGNGTKERTRKRGNRSRIGICTENQA